MKKLLIVTTFIIIFSFGALPVAAHVLLTTNSIGATLHVDPDDDPVAGQQTSFFLEFKDTENKFLLADCRCQAFIYHNGEEIFFTALKAINENAPLSSTFQFKFPAKGTYELVVKGTPINADAFKEFEIKDTLAVERENVTAVATSQSILMHWPKIIGILVIIGFMAIATVVSKRKINSPAANILP